MTTLPAEPPNETVVAVEYDETDFRVIWREDAAAHRDSPDERWFDSGINEGMAWEQYVKDARRFWVLDESDAETVTA